MHRVGHHIGELEQVEGALVRDDSAVPACGQPGGHHLLVPRGGIVAQPVEAAAQADEAPAGGMVGELLLAVAAGMGLRGGEIEHRLPLSPRDALAGRLMDAAYAA